MATEIMEFKFKGRGVDFKDFCKIVWDAMEDEDLIEFEITSSD